MGTSLTARSTEAGIPGPGRLKAALPGSRIDLHTTAERDAQYQQALVKADSGLWGFEMRIAGAEPVLSPANMDAKQAEAWCHRHSWAKDVRLPEGGYCISFTFTGLVVDRASLPSDACRRCGGLGKLEKFAHVDAGRCYDCGGTGKKAAR